MGAGCRINVPSSSSERPPNIVVYLADTLRADHLSAYGYGIDTSPGLVEFAREGVVFEQAYSHAPWTKPSVASLFTGVRPLVHRASISSWDFEHLMQQQVQTLRPKFQTLAEALKAQGYSTGYFLTNPHSQKEFGFAQGFDHYRYKGSATPTGLVDDAVEWISDEANAPYFAFVHEIDPHGPYTPSEEIFEQLHGDTPAKRLRALPNADLALFERLKFHYKAQGKRPDLRAFSDEGNRYLQELYDAEIRSVDREFQRLCEFLRKRKDWDKSIVVFTSDHGEAFGEHGAYFHGHSLFDELIHVPLVVGGGRVEPKRVPHTVNHFDLYPTLVGLAGGTTPEYVQGAPLLDRNGSILADEDRAVFSDIDFYSPDVSKWATTMVLGKHKVYRYPQEGGWVLKVFDRESDPSETIDLLESVDATDGTMSRLLAKFRKSHKEHSELAREFGPPQWTNSDAATQEELKALGYL